MKGHVTTIGIVLAIAISIGQQEKAKSKSVKAKLGNPVSQETELSEDKVFRDFKDAISEANRTGKPIFVYVFDSM